MNKKTLFTFFLLIALIAGAINFSPAVQKPFLYFANTLKNSYFQTIRSIEEKIEEHFFQAETIASFRRKLQTCQQQSLVLLKYKNDLQALYNLYNVQFNNDPHIELVRTLSYAKFGNTNRLWIEAKEYNASKIYGLVYKNYVAGIVVPKEGLPLALLNRDQQSSYAVSIGKEKAPGIAHGNEEKNIVVTYIPAWYNIHKGDEVITSGLDDIFFKGLKVGKVLSVSTAQGYKKAIVSPYYDSTELGYFYMIKPKEDR